MRNAVVSCAPAPIAASISSLRYGKCHCSGDSTTPSSEMKKFDTILPIYFLLPVSATTFARRPADAFPRNNAGCRDRSGDTVYSTVRFINRREEYMTVDQLSSTFSALADPTRRAILRRLVQQGDATVTELAEPFSISLQAVSKHLKVLERVGLIARERNAQLRLSRVRAAPLREAAE